MKGPLLGYVAGEVLAVVPHEYYRREPKALLAQAGYLSLGEEAAVIRGEHANP